MKKHINYSWIQFYHSGFKYRPIGNGTIERILSSSSSVAGLRFHKKFKTNKRPWAKQ